MQKHPALTLFVLCALIISILMPEEARTNLNTKPQNEINRISDSNSPRGDGKITLFNLHLKESVAVEYRQSDGDYNPEALKNINHALRCRHTNKEHDIPTELLEIVDIIQDHFGKKEVQVVSAYRSPELNANLRSQGRNVAKNSLHMKAQAMDIRIPGVSTSELRKFALQLKRGGVGFYPHDGFVHVDIGPFRTW